MHLLFPPTLVLALLWLIRRDGGRLALLLLWLLVLILLVRRSSVPLAHPRCRVLPASPGALATHGDGEELRIAGVDLAALVLAAVGLHVVVRECVAFAVEVVNVD